MDGRLITGLMFLVCAVLAGLYGLYCLIQEKKFRKNCTYTEGIVTGYEKTDSRIRLQVNFMEGEESVTALTQPEHMQMLDVPKGTRVPVSYLKIPDPQTPGQVKYEMYLEDRRVIRKSSKPYVVLAKVCAIFLILSVLMWLYFISP